MSWSYRGGDPGVSLFTACLEAGAPMPITPGMRVLEIGCCESDFLERASAAWPDVEWVGMDQRPRKAKDGFTVVQGDVLNSELFDPESFDAIVSLSAIEHVGLGHYGDPVDPDGDSKAMAHAGCWLKPGGWMYFDVPYDPSGYRVQTTECRVYDDDELLFRLTLPFRQTGRYYERVYYYSHAKAAGTLVPKPTEPVKPFHYCAMVWRKA